MTFCVGNVQYPSHVLSQLTRQSKLNFSRGGIQTSPYKLNSEFVKYKVVHSG